MRLVKNTQCLTAELTELSFGVLRYFSLFVIDHVFGFDYGEEGIGLFSGIFMLVNLLPSIAVFVRRLHDSGKSGWWYLLSLIPIIGLIVYILFGLAGSQENNKYGKKIH